MTEERKLILQMLQEGRVTVDEAERLLAAVNESPLSGPRGEAERPGESFRRERRPRRWADRGEFRSLLSNVDLTGVNLHGTRLSGADLTNAQLRHADLSDADLTDAILTDADLSHANLCRANLTGANLSGASLRGVCLPGADLSGLDLRGVNLKHANLSDVDLRNLVRHLQGLTETESEFPEPPVPYSGEASPTVSVAPAPPSQPDAPEPP